MYSLCGQSYFQISHPQIEYIIASALGDIFKAMMFNHIYLTDYLIVNVYF